MSPDLTRLSHRTPLKTLLLALLGAASTSLLAAPIEVSEIVQHEQVSYRLVTPSATWIYHREGAGFSQLVDTGGHDWISYRPTGGAAGHFRGLPNAVFRPRQAPGNFFHPGHHGDMGSNTEVKSTSPDRVLLRSTSVNQAWEGEWEILSDRARFTMTRSPANEGWWFLYEGTPGGEFLANDLCVRPNRRVTPLSESWESTLRDTPWVAFVSRTAKRTLVIVAQHSSDEPVSYRPMENAMTVLGFGRTLTSLENRLHGRRSFTVTLLSETDPARVSEDVKRFTP